MNLTESQVRSIVRQEMMSASSGARFAGVTPNNNHAHTGLDAPQISQNNILPGNSVEGSIAFAQQTTYKIGINFNPTAVWVHGNVVGNLGERFMVTGNAQLGPSLYLQPGSTTSVRPGGPPQDIIQSTTYFGVDSGGAFHTLVDEGHIVDIFYSTVRARATIIGYDSKNIIIQVDTLASGWTINLSLTIT